jgi:hypothetical protein
MPDNAAEIDDDSKLADAKLTLKRYLQQVRDALVWKLDGLGERAARLPRTPTGTNLAGLVRHCANVEIGYFGPVFGRDWPEPDDPCYVTDEADQMTDFLLPAEVTVAGLVAFYRRVWAFADATIDALPLDAAGTVPWWGSGRPVTLHRILVHVIGDLTRHAGHADILREQIDGAAGLIPSATNIPDGMDWPAHVARLTALADGAGE